MAYGSVAMVSCRDSDPRRYFLLKELIGEVPCTDYGRIGTIKYYYDGTKYNVEVPFSQDTVIGIPIRVLELSTKTNNSTAGDDAIKHGNDDGDNNRLENQEVLIDKKAD